MQLQSRQLVEGHVKRLQAAWGAACRGCGFVQEHDCIDLFVFCFFVGFDRFDSRTPE